MRRRLPLRRRSRGFVLLVDDDRDLVLGVSDLLAEEGYRVLSAGTGEAALRQLETARTPDLIILDLQLPGAVSGWDVHAAVKKSPALKAVPVVVISGSPLPASMRDEFNREKPFWLEKPLSRDALLAAIRLHLQSSRLSKQS
jgi:CheY-like chemotaxis protein